MYLLIPGRHQLITNFQVGYLKRICQQGLSNTSDVHGNNLNNTEPIEAIIFAVTSANHSNTRRNPLPFYLRAISIEAIADELNVPVYIYGVDDVGVLENFATYTIKRIRHESDGHIDCVPDNTIVVCSTPVLKLYEQLGFSILPAELADVNTWKHDQTMPWDIVEYIAGHTNWETDEWIHQQMHEASYAVWKKYHLGEKVQTLFRDKMISSDGDLTETRDYNVYVRQMDEIAELKYDETAVFVQPGRIGDIGCAVGSWIKLAAADARLRESDFYGIEVSRRLVEICRQRKENGEFKNPFVFFSQKNAVTGLVYDRNSMNTIHTSSLTHEIESYGSRADLLQFIKNRYEELAPGGIWINRDVVAPYNKDQLIGMWLATNDGTNVDPYMKFDDRHELATWLRSLSTYSRFLRFVKDFRASEGYHLDYSEKMIADKNYIRLSMRDAAEFLSRKDYADNWQSEMHETFCFWDFNEWKEQLQQAGFTIHPSSYSFTNNWIVKNRWEGKAALFNLDAGTPIAIEFPVTHFVLIGVKQ